jgi:hypothetical protein
MFLTFSKGALGIPPILGLRLSKTETKQFSFVNTKVAQMTIHALQAIGLDEHRAIFSPCIWELPNDPDNLRTLKQVWFAGVHCNTGGGGGYEDQGLANISLAWMINQLQTIDGGLLDFDEDYLRWIFRRNIDHCNAYYTGTERDQAGDVVHDSSGFRGWGLGRIEETMADMYSLLGDDDSAGVAVVDRWRPGNVPRTPGRYERIDAVAAGGESVKTGNKLYGTNERVHCSVRVRAAMPGAKSVMVKGVETDGYVPWALKGWQLVGGGASSSSAAATDPLAGGFSWKSPDGGKVVLEEEGLGPLERLLLDMSRQAAVPGPKK